jgi:hypothetical protein
MLNITRIPAPRVTLVDPQTGIVSDQWFRFLNNIYTIVGSNLGIVQIVNGGTGLGTMPANGQLLIGDAVNGYVLNTLTPASGIGITNGAGAITIANTGVLSNIAGAGISVSGATGNVTIANTGVLSFSAGATGLTPSATTAGAVTLAGTLALTNGGTGGTSAATARTNLGVTATGADTTYAYRANNLSDLASAATARTNLGLGTIAVKNTGATGTFTTVDLKTVTVTDGIIVSIV